MSLFMIFSAIMAGIIFIAKALLNWIEESDRKKGSYEPKSHYTIFGIIKETLKENFNYYKNKIHKKKTSA